jgi:tRNA A-37 threonylcarbamoyl transferase component Bud32/ribosomal protein L37AE/L43A
MGSYRLFGELAVARGWLAPGQLQRLLAEQAAQPANRRQHLGELGLAHRLLDEQQIAFLLVQQGKRQLICPECFSQFNVRGFDPAHSHPCRKCGEPLADPGDLSHSAISHLSGSHVESYELDDEQPDRPLLAGRALLTFKQGPCSGLELRLGEGETLQLGSGSDMDVVLAEPSIQALHCKITSSGTHMMLVSVHSPTNVNGQPIDFAQLREGDTIELGENTIVAHPWLDANARNGSAPRPLIGRILIERGLLGATELKSVLRQQEQLRWSQGQAPRLGELLERLGLLSEHQVLDAQQQGKQRRLHARCPGCGNRFNLREEDLGINFECSSCGKPIQIPRNPLLLQPRSATATRHRPVSTAARTPRVTEPVRIDTIQAAALQHNDDSDQDATSVCAFNAPDDEQEYAALAYREHYVTSPQLERALELLRQRRSRGELTLSLGQVLIEQRYLMVLHHRQLLNKLGIDLGEVEIPGYQIMRKLGQGASGTVYEALKLSGRRPVALKIIRPELCYDERFVKRFHREAEAALRLRHPGIIAGVDAGQHSHFLFMAMELFDGETVDAYLRRESRMSERFALEVAYHIALALAYASSHQLIHRDVKPSNIVIGRDGTAKLIDLGLAKQVSSGSSVTQTGLIIGTPNYISPEQARGDRLIDHRADIYSLGATLYHMVTGELPFRGDSPMETMVKHIQEPLRPPRQLTQEVSRVVSLLIQQMMAKPPEQRFQRWEDIAGKLETLLGR